MKTSKVHLGDHRESRSMNQTFTRSTERVKDNSRYAGLNRHKPNNYCIITGRPRVNSQSSNYESYFQRSHKDAGNKSQARLNRSTMQNAEEGLKGYRNYNIVTNK